MTEIDQRAEIAALRAVADAARTALIALGRPSPTGWVSALDLPERFAYVPRMLAAALAAEVAPEPDDED